MSEEPEEWVVEDQVRSLEAAFWAAKRKAREETDPTWKKANMNAQEIIAAGLALTDYDLHQDFRNAIGARMNKQDPDIDEAANWTEKGWGFGNWEETSSEIRSDSFKLIVADVQAFLVKEGLIAAVEESVEAMEEQLEIAILQRELAKIQSEAEEPELADAA